MTDVFGTKLYTPREAKGMLGIGKNKIYELLKNGELEYVDLGGRKRLTEQGIKNFIAKKTIRINRPELYPKK